MSEAMIVNQLGELLQYLKEVNAIHGGNQLIFKFPNGYGASIVQHAFSYGSRDGCWEMAVTTFTSETEWSITYDTPITNDVEALTPEEAIHALHQIKQLPAQATLLLQQE